jgi:phage FluMu protein Com
MKEIRCDGTYKDRQCNHLIAKISIDTTIIPNNILENITDIKEKGKDNATIEIKCPKCGKMHIMNT